MKSQNIKEILTKGIVLCDIPPLKEERKFIEGKKIIVEFSGGKDSSAVAAYASMYFPEHEIELLYCDLGSDYVGLQTFLYDFADYVGINLRIIRSSEPLLDVMLRKGKWPHFRYPYCKELLIQKTLWKEYKKFAPDEIIIFRGTRIRESTGGKSKKKKITEFCLGCNSLDVEVDSEKAQTCSKEEGNLGITSRLATFKTLKGYVYYNPLYFSNKATSVEILRGVHAPIWVGY
jgi:PP-loop superfamily ATP-utilizing enzyme